MRNLKPTALSAALLLTGTACATHAMRRGSQNQETARPGRATALSTEELSEDGPAPLRAAATPDRPAKGGKVQAGVPSLAQRQGCRSLVDRFAPAYRALFQLVPQGVYVPSGGPLDQLVQASVNGCDGLKSRGPLVEAVTNAVTGHSGKVGVILPLSGPRAAFGAYVATGMRAAFQEAGANFDQAVVLKDSAGSAKAAETALAELVFRDRVALVIGGLDRGDAEVLAKWSADLLLPTVLLSRDRDLTAVSKQVFLLYPDEKHLADTLVAAAIRRGNKRFAILKPSTGKSDKVSEFFKAAVLASGGQVAYDLAYTPNNFDSMQGASRQLFQADAADRAGEYRAAFLKARQQALREGVPFDARMVVLKPIVAFDAIFIPDDFRTVRHFAKLFKYHMVDHLAMIGNHEWRSPSLIDPYDDFLDGAIFADFIGSYAKLPPSVGAQTLGSPFFVHPQNVVTVDFQLIGYRAGRVANRAVQNQVNRRQLPAALSALSGEAAGFPGVPAVFDADRRCNWPTYLFAVGNRTLTLEADPANAALTQAGAGARTFGGAPLAFAREH